MDERKPMTHKMEVQGQYFEQLVAGQKTIESRTYDLRRQAMQVGDFIEMTNLDDGAIVKLRITSMDVYPDLASLYASYPPEITGFPGKSVEEIVAIMGNIYKPEVVNQWGMVAIGVSLNLEKEITDPVRTIGVHPTTKPPKKD